MYPKEENKGAGEIFQKMGNVLPSGASRNLDINFHPTLEDLGDLRYQFYIHNGIDAINIGALEQQWLDNIWNRVPFRLKAAYFNLSAHLSDQICDEYRVAVKKAVVEFVLHEPDKYRRVEMDSGPRNDPILMHVPKLWHHSVVIAKKKLARNLHAYNPVMGYIHLVWKAVFW